MTPPIVAAKNVSRAYDKAHSLTVLSDVTLEIQRGQYVAITGPSGSGKSTLLHILCGIDLPTGGEVFFDGIRPGTTARWRAIRARRIGLVFQSFNLMPTFTAQENVEAPMFGVAAGSRERSRRARSLLERVGLGQRMRHRPNELSGGEKQRLAIARALANSPDLLLADEPTGNLDSRTSAEILSLMEGLRDEHGCTLVIVTHDPTVASRATRAIKLLDGRVHSDLES